MGNCNRLTKDLTEKNSSRTIFSKNFRLRRWAFFFGLPRCVYGAVFGSMDTSGKPDSPLNEPQPEPKCIAFCIYTKVCTGTLTLLQTSFFFYPIYWVQKQFDIKFAVLATRWVTRWVVAGLCSGRRFFDAQNFVWIKPRFIVCLVKPRFIAWCSRLLIAYQSYCTFLYWLLLIYCCWFIYFEIKLIFW
jgi:hypothetical protein